MYNWVAIQVPIIKEIKKYLRLKLTSCIIKIWTRKSIKQEVHSLNVKRKTVIAVAGIVVIVAGIAPYATKRGGNRN